MPKPDPAEMLFQLYIVHKALNWLVPRFDAVDFILVKGNWRATFCHCLIEPKELRRRAAAGKQAVVNALTARPLELLNDAAYDLANMHLNDSTNTARLMQLHLIIRNARDKAVMTTKRLQHQHEFDTFDRLMMTDLMFPTEFDEYTSVLLSTIDCKLAARALGAPGLVMQEHVKVAKFMWDRRDALSLCQTAWES